MVRIMTYAGVGAADAPGTRTGGVPHTPAAFAWPQCRSCRGHMQFVAQVSLSDVTPGDEGLLSIFMCQNDPGLCDEWDARSGGNRAFAFGPGSLHAAVPPGDGVTQLEAVSAVRFEDVDVDDYLAVSRPGREVLGQVGGRPGWLQGEEAPACDECGEPMMFVVQLEEGHDHRTAANFGGGGCGYGFRCGPCATAAFLWQC